jgi:hypothetical protein
LHVKNKGGKMKRSEPRSENKNLTKDQRKKRPFFRGKLEIQY